MIIIHWFICSNINHDDIMIIIPVCSFNQWFMLMSAKWFKNWESRVCTRFWTVFRNHVLLWKGYKSESWNRNFNSHFWRRDACRIMYNMYNVQYVYYCIYIHYIIYIHILIVIHTAFFAWYIWPCWFCSHFTNHWSSWFSSKFDEFHANVGMKLPRGPQVKGWWYDLVLAEKRWGGNQC